jgi:hypothetical protein
MRFFKKEEVRNNASKEGTSQEGRKQQVVG